MKFSRKIFIISFLIIVVSFGLGGFALVNSVFTESLNSKISSACDNNRYAAASFYAMSKNYIELKFDETYIDELSKNFSKQLSSNNSDTTVTVSKEIGSDNSLASELEDNTRAYKVFAESDKKYIQVASLITDDFSFYYVQTYTDISDIFAARETYIRTYQLVLICVSLFSSLILLFVSGYITKPLVKLSNVTREIAGGDFSKRAEKTNTKEINELSENFNIMAQNIEDYICLLKESAQSRDDFVADFTHELKTPLTSVIGYADMLRSYELDEDERRNCAEYIYREGKRLESLSSNLLNLIVLKQDEINLIAVSSDTLMNETGNTVKFLLRKYNVSLDINFESAVLSVEPSLIKTLIYNLIDNACKASRAEQTVEVLGYMDSGRYRFKITDHGIGIPESELNKITRPFYMVDKSRSRKLGGAGLGLALCNKIAVLHGSSLEIKSREGEGTEINFSVSAIGKDGDFDE